MYQFNIFSQSLIMVKRHYEILIFALVGVAQWIEHQPANQIPILTGIFQFY